MKNKHDECDYYIEKRALGELFDSKYSLDVNLWRGQKPKDSKNPILYPLLKAYLLSNGNKREADVDLYRKRQEEWVKANGKGVSLFDVLGVPHRKWTYYKIPAGITIPNGLVITKDRLNKKHKSHHYSICPHWDMPIKKFLMLLDEITAELILEK